MMILMMVDSDVPSIFLKGWRIVHIPVQLSHHACMHHQVVGQGSIPQSHPSLRMDFFIYFIELIDVLGEMGVPPTVLANLSSFYTIS